MNSASRIVQTSSQWLISTSTATAPADRAQHEADRDRQHVDDDDVLERTRVERPAARDRRPRRARTPAEREGARPAPPAPSTQRGAERDRHRQRARRDRPLRLERMPAIAVAIGDVVDEIDDARQRAEHRRSADTRVDAPPADRTACRPNSSPAKTSRFLVHWAGRSERSRLRASGRPGTASSRGTGSRHRG